jgi:hypothetical protein
MEDFYRRYANTSAILPELPTSLTILGTKIAVVAIEKSALEQLTKRNEPGLIFIPEIVKQQQRERFWYGRIAAIGPKSIAPLAYEQVSIGDIVAINKATTGHEIEMDGVRLVILADASQIEMKIELDATKEAKD